MRQKMMIRCVCSTNGEENKVEDRVSCHARHRDGDQEQMNPT